MEDVKEGEIVSEDKRSMSVWMEATTNISNSTEKYTSIKIGASYKQPVESFQKAEAETRKLIRGWFDSLFVETTASVKNSIEDLAEKAKSNSEVDKSKVNDLTSKLEKARIEYKKILDENKALKLSAKRD